MDSNGSSVPPNASKVSISACSSCSVSCTNSCSRAASFTCDTGDVSEEQIFSSSDRIDVCSEMHESSWDWLCAAEAAKGSNPTRGVIGANGSELAMSLSLLSQAASWCDFCCGSLVSVLVNVLVNVLGLVLRFLHLRSGRAHLGSSTVMPTGQESMLIVVVVLIHERGSLSIVIVLSSFTPSPRNVSLFSAIRCSDISVSLPALVVNRSLKRWFMSLNSPCSHSATNSVPPTLHFTGTW